MHGARRAWEAFSGKPANRLTRAELRDIKAAWELGKIHAIEYVASDNAKLYRHDFGKNRPALGSSPDGKQLVILGGGYRVTDRGIEG